MRRRIRAAVLGATGLVGQYFVHLLSNHPVFNLSVLVASESKRGMKYGDAISKWFPPRPPDSQVLSKEVFSPGDLRLEDIDLVFSALPSEVARCIEKDLLSKGFTIVSNASPMRLEPFVPLVNPEVNIEHISVMEKQRVMGWRGRIAKNPNCTTAILTLTLKPLQDAYGIRKVFMTSLQAVSGAGIRGHYALDIMCNVIPFIGGEEEKVVNETKKIMGEVSSEGIVPRDDILVVPTATRVPVLVGHTLSVAVELKQPPSSVEEIASMLESWRTENDVVRNLPMIPEKPLVVFHEEDRPQPLFDSLLSGGMTVAVGRLRITGNILSYIAVGNNLVRGAAGIAVAIGEYLAHERLV